MFVLEHSPLYWWPVTVNTPSPDKPGEYVSQTFEAQFENIPRAEARKIRDELLQLSGAEYEAREDDVIRRVLRGWRDIQDASKVDVPFTPETFEAAWQQSWFRIGVLRAWQESISGEKARLGN